MTRKRKIPGQKPKKRAIDWAKYPRALGARHGLHLVEDLFPGLTPKGWSSSPPPKDDEGGNA